MSEYVYRVVDKYGRAAYTRQSNSHATLYAQERTAKAQVTRLNELAKSFPWSWPHAPYRVQRARVVWEDIDD